MYNRMACISKKGDCLFKYKAVVDNDIVKIVATWYRVYRQQMGDGKDLGHPARKGTGVSGDDSRATLGRQC